MKFRTKIFVAALVVFTLPLCANSNADIVYSTGFNSPTYSDGPLIGQDGWVITGTSVVNPVNVANVGTDGDVTLTTTGQDVRRAFTAAAASVSNVFLSADIMVSSAQTTGDYFIHLGDNTTTNFYSRIYARASTTAGMFQLAMGTSSGTAGLVYGGDLALNSLFNINAQYVIVPGLANDVGQLFVNGNAYVAATTTGIDATIFSSVSLRQGTGTNAANVTVDNIVVTTIPEPTAAGLCAMVLVGMIGRRRR